MSKLKLLIDNGVVSGADFLIGSTQEQESTWGPNAATVTITGFRRVAPDNDADQQKEKDALFTIDRLARAGRITLLTYPELQVENWRRGRGREPLVNALAGCHIATCASPLERSKFRHGVGFDKWIAKGGQADARKGLPANGLSQLSFMDWLMSLSFEAIDLISRSAEVLHLDDFEKASLHDLAWFQNMARAMNSHEGLTDCFHLWAARRNELDGLLTLEKRLPRTVEHLKRRRGSALDFKIQVIRPTEALRLLSVTKMDPVPLQHERFYTYMEVFEIDRELRDS